ncbi:TPA: hypothetical protein G9F23_002669 [Salmonella enterica]|nr:hypothetical protein [Salmonella enterica]HAF4703989.1 hypothetical protein [Salmonella enterica]
MREDSVLGGLYLMAWSATFRGFTVVAKNSYHGLVHGSGFWLVRYSGMIM